MEIKHSGVTVHRTDSQDPELKYCCTIWYGNSSLSEFGITPEEALAGALLAFKEVKTEVDAIWDYLPEHLKALVYDSPRKTFNGM